MAGSYIPLYRKYRPQSFKDLVGQEAIVKTLSNAIELNKVAHAYLFTGPRGTGKTSAARIFAKSLNCEKGPTTEPCGVCPSCIDITAGNAMDVIEIDAASNRKVEDARNLLEKVQFVPVSGKYKVYIIDEVHMLTTEAFNTLLKTLEEPPKNLVFILATTESHKVLNTIISRCQRFDFRRIPQDLMIGRLKKISAIENLKINSPALSLISRRSAGGLRDALGLLDQASVLASIEAEITDSDILNLVGSLSEDFLFKITDSIANKDSQNLITHLSLIVEMGNEPLMILRELTHYFRNLMLLRSSSNPSEIRNIIDVSENFFDEITSQSQRFEVVEIAQIIEKISNFEKTLKTSSQQQLWLEVALISICYRQDIQILKDLEERIQKLENALSGGNIPVSRPAVIESQKPVYTQPPIQQLAAPKQEPVAETVSVQQLKDSTPIQKTETPIQIVENNSANSSINIDHAWAALLERIDSIPSRMFFHNLSKPVEINSNKIIITFSVESFAKQAQEKTKLGPLEKAAEKLFGTIPRIVTRTPQPEDDQIRQTSKTSAPVSSTTLLQSQPPEIRNEEKKEILEQISQNFEEVPIPVKSVVAPIVKIESTIDENINEVEKIEKTPFNINISEQTKMIVDLFQGKIIE